MKMMIELELKAIYNEDGLNVDWPDICKMLNPLPHFAPEGVQQVVDENGKVYYYLYIFIDDEPIWRDGMAFKGTLAETTREYDITLSVYEYNHLTDQSFEATFAHGWLVDI